MPHVASTLHSPEPLPLDGGQSLPSIDIAYATYGTLSQGRDNAVLVCHALTGDQHIASPHPLTGKPGWWDRMVGPGKPIDTDRLFVIGVNVLGGCMGSSGPASLAPDGERYALRFPLITVADMVRAQMRLLDHLGIDRLYAVVGGSMGGMQALVWAAHYPARVRSALVIASSARHSAQNIALHEVGRQAIMGDPNWHGGAYHAANATPEAGLATARMLAHISYLSDAGLDVKFGRRLQDRAARSFSFDADFQVESYLRHQGRSFVARFDANSYLYITRAVDYFDLAADFGGDLANAFKRSSVRFGVISFDSDWLYPPSASHAIADALARAGAAVDHWPLSSPFGHDAFLLDTPGLDDSVRAFLAVS